MNTQPAQRHATAATILYAGLAVLLLAQLAAAWDPGIAVWGFDHWSSFPVGLRFGLFALAGLCLVPAVARLIEARREKLSASPLLIPLAAVAAFALFYIFRSRAFVYGDGYSYVHMFADGSFPALERQLATHPIDLAVHWLVQIGLVGPSGGTVATTYALVSAVAGVLSGWAVVRLATLIAGPHAATRRLVIAGAITSGALALWFGYVEAYTLTQAAGLWSLVFACRSLAERKWLGVAWITWLVASATHMVTLVFLPALLWVSWRGRKTPLKPVSRGRAVLFVVGVLLVAGIGAQIVNAVGTAIFVGFLPTAESPYSAFAITHLRDVLNQWMLVAPFGLLGLVVWLAVPAPSYREKLSRSEEQRHGAQMAIGLAALGAAVFAFWIDPLLGAVRDWDLLAGFGLPVSIWSGTVIAARLKRWAQIEYAYVAVAAFGVVHLGGFVAGMQDPMAAAERIDTILRADVHYTGAYRQGERIRSWAAILSDELDRHDLAKYHCGVRVRTVPGDPNAWANLGSVYRFLEQFDSSATCYERAAELNPAHPAYLHNLGLLNLWQGKLDDAQDAFERDAVRSTTAYETRAQLGKIYVQKGELHKADSIYREARAIDDSRPEAHVALADLAHRQGDTTEAITHYREALNRGGRSEEVYRRLTQLLQWSGRASEAVTVAREWERVFPSSPGASLFMGLVFVTLGQHDSANVALHRAVALNPADAVATYYLATTYRHLGQPQRARELAMTAARIDTLLSLPWLELVYLADDAGDRAAAVVATREYLRRSPGDSVKPYFQQFLEP